MTKRGGHQQEKDMHVLKHIHNNISRLQVLTQNLSIVISLNPY